MILFWRYTPLSTNYQFDLKREEVERLRPQYLNRILFILFLFVSFNLSVWAEPPTRKVLILDISRLTKNEMIKSPVLHSFVVNGSTGIITTNINDPLTLGKIYYTFNSGILLKTTEELAGQIFDATEEFQKNSAAAVYYTYTGLPLSAVSAAQMRLGKLLQLNTAVNLEKIGLFGRTLHQYHLKTAVIGNADTEVPNRSGAAMVIDRNGRIDYGAVGSSTLQSDERFPFGHRTDSEQILNKLKEFQPKAEVIVVTLGDFERLEAFRAYLSPLRYEHYRQEILTQYNQLLRNILNQVDRQQTLVMLFTPLPPFDKYGAEARLSTVTLSGATFKKGLLFSSSTRRKGIITLNDLPVTLLDFLGIRTSGYESGRVLKTVPGSFNESVEILPQLVANYRVRWPLLTGYAYILIGIILCSIFGIIFWSEQQMFFKILGNLFLWLLTFPGVFLWESYFNPLSWWAIFGLTFGMASIVYGLAYFFGKAEPFKMLGLISLFVTLSIVIDALFNGQAELISFLGYSAVVGARFYGIGNEYLGLLLGSYIVFVSLNQTFFNQKHEKLLWLLVLILTIVIAHPNFGANIGGGITALFGLGYATYLWIGRSVKLKEILWLGGAVICLLILIGCWDFYLSGNLMTHFGQLVLAIKVNGIKVLQELVLRKWNLNLRLIGFTPWTYVLLGMVSLIPILYYTQTKKIAWLFDKYPTIMQGLFGMVTTGLVGLVVNDSGIVTLAMIFVFGIALFLLVVFHELENFGMIMKSKNTSSKDNL